MMLERDAVTGKYILRIDASLYKETDCLRYVLYKLIYGYSTNSGMVTKEAKMEYGTAGHKFLQARYDGKSLEEQLAAAHEHFSDPSIVVADSEWRNIGHLTNTLVTYDMYYKQNGDHITPTATEQRFMYPFYKTDKVEVLVCGTADLRGEYFQQGAAIIDHKFTAAWNKYEYLGEYDLSVQLMLYKWICDKLFNADHGCMINGIFISKVKPASFMRSDLLRFSSEQIGCMVAHLRSKVIAIVEALEYMLAYNSDELFTPNYCACIKRYGEKASPCAYTMLCKQPRMEEAIAIADSMFEKKSYNPMLFQL